MPSSAPGGKYRSSAVYLYRLSKSWFAGPKLKTFLARDKECVKGVSLAICLKLLKEDHSLKHGLIAVFHWRTVISKSIVSRFVTGCSNVSLTFDEANW